MATDGTLSYAIFTYHCGHLNSNNAGIGFSITQDFFANHELSLTPNVNDIACAGVGEWSNVVYLVSAQGTNCLGLNPCQNGGTCITTDNGSNYRCSCPLFYTGYNCEGVAIYIRHV